MLDQVCACVFRFVHCGSEFVVVCCLSCCLLFVFLLCVFRLFMLSWYQFVHSFLLSPYTSMYPHIHIYVSTYIRTEIRNTKDSHVHREETAEQITKGTQKTHEKNNRHTTTRTISTGTNKW